MKLWLDTIVTSQLSAEHDECGGGDCGDCPNPDGVSIPSISLNSQHIQTHSFVQTESLYKQAYDNEKWLVCNTTGSGQIALLDQQAMAILEHFRAPATLSKSIQHTPGWTHVSIERAIALFYRLTFIQDIHHPQIPQKSGLPRTLSAWLHVTNACNLRCQYCYLQKTSEHMLDATARHAVDAVFRSATKHHYQRVQLKYAGGEASLHLANMLAAHDYAVDLAYQHALKLHAYIMSNGVALSQRVIDQLQARHIDIMISLDGLGSYHDRQRSFINGKGSFKYVHNTIMRILGSSFKPHINVTVSQRNLDGLPDLMEYLLKYELPFTFSYYRDNDCSSHIHDLQFTEKQMVIRMREMFRMIEQHLPRYRLIDSLIDKAKINTLHTHTCGVGHDYLVINQHGEIAKCHADINRTITNIAVDDPLEAIRSDLNGVRGFSVEDKEGCRTCEWRYWCAGGCPLLTYRVTGRSDVKSPNCNIYKALFPEALRLEALRLLKYTSPITL